MSAPTSGQYDDEWSNQTDYRMGAHLPHPLKRRRTESYETSTQEEGIMRDFKPLELDTDQEDVTNEWEEVDLDRLDEVPQVNNIDA